MVHPTCHSKGWSPTAQTFFTLTIPALQLVDLVVTDHSNIMNSTGWHEMPTIPGAVGGIKAIVGDMPSTGPF